MANNSYISSDESSFIISNTDVNIKNEDIGSSLQSLKVSITSHKKDYVVVLVLFIINLLNYMDRYTITGLLTDIKNFYNVGDTHTGLLQTSFIVSYMIMCPIFGYLGDRISRKWIVISGVTFWSLITLSSSFIPSNMFWLFVVMRSLLGVGEASYSTVAPTIISDLFTSEWRTKLMAFFCFAIPIGSGCGFIVGFALKTWFNDWKAALRLTPILGVLCLILLFLLVKEPERGHAEGGRNLVPTSWIEDIWQLTNNPSFLLITFGFTGVCFVLGSLSWYAVVYLEYAADAEFPNSSKSKNINYIFGSMTVVAGLIGVVIGSEAGRRLRRTYAYADPLVCAFGLIVGAPCFLVSMVLAKYYSQWTLVIIFITQILLCFNWALVTDMTMSVVIPSRRATASAYQMIVAHALGDAGSPYFIGLIKDAVKKTFDFTVNKNDVNYYSMQYALLTNTPVLVIGGLFFICASFYIVNDKRNVAKNIEESRKNNETGKSAYQSEDT